MEIERGGGGGCNLPGWRSINMDLPVDDSSYPWCVDRFGGFPWQQEPFHTGVPSNCVHGLMLNYVNWLPVLFFYSMFTVSNSKQSLNDPHLFMMQLCLTVKYSRFFSSKHCLVCTLIIPPSFLFFFFGIEIMKLPWCEKQRTLMHLVPGHSSTPGFPLDGIKCVLESR